MRDEDLTALVTNSPSSQNPSLHIKVLVNENVEGDYLGPQNYAYTFSRLGNPSFPFVEKEA